MHPEVRFSLCQLRDGRQVDPAKVANPQTQGCLYRYMYQFESLGDDEAILHTSTPSASDESYLPLPAVPFQRHLHLVNLSEIDKLPSISPIIDAKVVGNPSGHPTIHIASGNGERSTLRKLRYGTTCQELLEMSLNFRPTGLWMLKGDRSEWYPIN